LIGRDGNVAGRFAPTDKPGTLEEAIETELNKGV
jgi:glutathione peroxidase-family protein